MAEEKTDWRKFGWAVAVMAFVAVVSVLTILAPPAGDDGDVALPTRAAIEIDLAAAEASILILQAKVDSETVASAEKHAATQAEIAALKARIGKLEAPPRKRAAPPDPPASSYLKLQ